MHIDDLPEILSELLDYEQATGKLIWRARKAKHFSHTDSPVLRCDSWNKRCAGNEALTSVGSHGYKTGRIFDIQVLAHRVILAMELGRWPTAVDHINGDRTDNRRTNLREVSKSENSRNCRRTSRNKSGVVGVYWADHAQKWRSEIQDSDGRKHLGYFTSKGEAIAVRKSAERENGYHPNHGRSA